MVKTNPRSPQNNSSQGPFLGFPQCRHFLLAGLGPRDAQLSMIFSKNSSSRVHCSPSNIPYHHHPVIHSIIKSTIHPPNPFTMPKGPREYY